MGYNLELNKQNAIAFYRTAYLGDPSKAVESYVGAEYIQHNPLVANGKQAFIDYFEEMAKKYPDKKIEFVRAVAEGDLVALHTHQTWPGDEQYVTMDFFRFDENGKIIITFIEERNSLKIRIFNTGKGIEASELDRVFERLYRGDYARGTPGTGLGLSITRQIAELHQGSVKILSKTNLGTTVILSIKKF